MGIIIVRILIQVNTYLPSIKNTGSRSGITTAASNLSRNSHVDHTLALVDNTRMLLSIKSV